MARNWSSENYSFVQSNDFEEGYVFGPSLTRQEFKDQVDINVMMANYESTGDFPIDVLGNREPKYVDFTVYPDNLMDYMNMMRNAEEAFMRLPASVRTTFDNDAARFVEFASDEKNLDQMVAWDLAKAPDPPSTAVGGGGAAPADAAPATTSPPASATKG